MTAALRIEIEDRLGNRQVVHVRPPLLTPEQHALARGLLEGLCAELHDAGCVDPEGAITVWLVQHEHDEAAYRRACERRGVLAL